MKLLSKHPWFALCCVIGLIALLIVAIDINRTRSLLDSVEESLHEESMVVESWLHPGEPAVPGSDLIPTIRKPVILDRITMDRVQAALRNSSVDYVSYMPEVLGLNRLLQPSRSVSKKGRYLFCIKSGSFILGGKYGELVIKAASGQTLMIGHDKRIFLTEFPCRSFRHDDDGLWDALVTEISPQLSR